MQRPSFAPHNVDTWFQSDYQFHQLYPAPMQALARRHWTPLTVVQKASRFLAAEPGARILDIGCGIGKFCLGAAYFKPDALYYGIEQRRDLVGYAETARDELGFENVSFLHGNFTQLDLRDYDHFYFYNSFHENLETTARIDDSIAYSGELYNYYSRYLFRQLDQLPAGARLATFHSMENEIPPDFHVVGTEMSNLLKFWIKTD
ncbi:methyltransferase domain-containing protein [Foetidibacter luteolus]|uniref:methyltransferase domain-containing protein n=1 Tax=Foetidibacter luteolus TaxID=2608880 RepID=UPI00129B2CB2|nr:methyltransferase domain-containing protein [Foetidibacter luteolus]